MSACLTPVCPQQLSERYGPMFTIQLGSQKTVVLSGYEVVREALVGTGPELADRPPIPIFQFIQRGGGRWAFGLLVRWGGDLASWIVIRERQDQSTARQEKYDPG